MKSVGQSLYSLGEAREAKCYSTARTKDHTELASTLKVRLLLYLYY